MEGLTTKGHMGVFWSEGAVLCFDCGSGYMVVCLSETAELHIMNRGEFYCIYIIP